jgi:hypothetical protein
MKRQFILALLMGAAGLFTACQLDEKQAVDVGGGDVETYSISIDTEPPAEDERDLYVWGKAFTKGKVSGKKIGRAEEGTSVILEVELPKIKAASQSEPVEGESEETPDVNWFVRAPIKSADGFSAFKKAGENSWEFKMPARALTINVAFTNEQPDPNNAYLAELGASKGGELVPDLSHDNDSYKILVPFDTTLFYIYAQPESSSASSIMTKGGAADDLLNEDITLGGGGAGCRRV